MCEKSYIDVIKIAREQFPLTKQIEGFDGAIIGLHIRIEGVTNFIYSLNKLLMIIMNTKAMAYDESVIYFELHIRTLHDFDDETSPLIFDDRPHFSLN